MTQFTASAPETAGQWRIGRDMCPPGRVIRIVAGMLFAAADAASAATTIHQGKATAGALAGQAALAFGVAAAACTFRVWALGERFPTSIGAWLAALDNARSA